MGAKGMVFRVWAHEILSLMACAMAGTQDWCMAPISSIVGLLILYSLNVLSP